MGDAAANARKRNRLHIEQDGKCFYCPQPIGAHVGGSVLEHFIPRSKGGRRLVLACVPCDRMKGMIPGPKFQALIASMALPDDNPNQIRQKIAARCKQINSSLQEAHQPRVAGEVKTRERTERRAKQVGVTITEFVHQARKPSGGRIITDCHGPEWATK